MKITKIKQQCKHWIHFVLKAEVEIIFKIHVAEKFKR